MKNKKSQRVKTAPGQSLPDKNNNLVTLMHCTGLMQLLLNFSRLQKKP